jgi:RNA recognition motif-containing protein
MLPERNNVVKPQLNSPEFTIQENRIASTSRVQYVTDFDVPLSPDPLNDVEQALDMTSQASAVVFPIPFFAPQVAPPVVAPPNTYIDTVVEQPIIQAPIAPQALDEKASFEFIQSLGLPFYLVGQPTTVIQTIAASPSLLSSVVDANGTYDQQKMLNLVHSMSSNNSLSNPLNSHYPPKPVSAYTPYNASAYGDTLLPPSQNSRTVVRKSDEGNLHVSGYGQGTTESDLIAAFAPYVHVDEVVLKGTFAFVNTSDPNNAQRARDALTGTLLNGMPIRINNATRKMRDNTNSFSVPPPPALVSSVSQPRQSVYGTQTSTVVPPIASGLTHPAFGAIHPNIDSVRDDRGNPPTKNLFVAGYGPGTNEQMLRDLFGKFAVVTGVVVKGSFAFVNTSDRHEAVVARENIGGTMFNGGVLRINFAKETGRLGTSFDLTYGPNTGPNMNRVAGTTRTPNMSYYGIN